jgi:hypothetical protein
MRFKVGLIGAFIWAMPRRADDPGRAYSQVPQGAYSVVAEMRAKRGKEPSCVLPHCLSSELYEMTRIISSTSFKTIVSPLGIFIFYFRSPNPSLHQTRRGMRACVCVAELPPCSSHVGWRSKHLRPLRELFTSRGTIAASYFVSFDAKPAANALRPSS